MCSDGKFGWGVCSCYFAWPARLDPVTEPHMVLWAAGTERATGQSRETKAPRGETPEQGRQSPLRALPFQLKHRLFKEEKWKCLTLLSLKVKYSHNIHIQQRRGNSVINLKHQLVQSWARITGLLVSTAPAARLDCLSSASQIIRATRCKMAGMFQSDLT